MQNVEGGAPVLEPCEHKHRQEVTPGFRERGLKNSPSTGQSELVPILKYLQINASLRHSQSHWGGVSFSLLQFYGECSKSQFVQCRTL